METTGRQAFWPGVGQIGQGLGRWWGWHSGLLVGAKKDRAQPTQDRKGVKSPKSKPSGPVGLDGSATGPWHFFNMQMEGPPVRTVATPQLETWGHSTRAGLPSGPPPKSQDHLSLQLRASNREATKRERGKEGMVVRRGKVKRNRLWGFPG